MAAEEPPFLEKRARVCKPLKKGKWSPEEDKVLRSFIKTQQGIKPSWPLLRNHTQDLDHRDIKSCRLRFENHLKPGLRKGPLSLLEQDRVRELQKQHGNQWAYIAAQLPGRTDNMVKNWWNARYRPRSNRLKKKGLLWLKAEKMGARKGVMQASAAKGCQKNSFLHYNDSETLPQRESLSEIKERVRAVSRKGSPTTYCQQEVRVKKELVATAAKLDSVTSSASGEGGDAVCGIKNETCQDKWTSFKPLCDPSKYCLKKLASIKLCDQQHYSAIPESYGQSDPLLNWKLKIDYSSESPSEGTSDKEIDCADGLGIQGATVWLSSGCCTLDDAQSKLVENGSPYCNEDVLPLAAHHASIPPLLDTFEQGICPATPDPGLPDFFAELEDLSRPVSNTTMNNYPSVGLPTLTFVPAEYWCCTDDESACCLDHALETPPGLEVECRIMQKEA